MNLIAESHMENIAPHEPQPHQESAASHVHKQPDFEDNPGGEVKGKHDTTKDLSLEMRAMPRFRYRGIECDQL